MRMHGTVSDILESLTISFLRDVIELAHLAAQALCTLNFSQTITVYMYNACDLARCPGQGKQL